MPRGEGTEARRSSRVALRVPMQVYERGKDERYIIETVHSSKVSLWGGLVRLNSFVKVGEKVVVVNQTTLEAQQARVVYVVPLQREGNLVGFEFLHASPNFWGLGFPAVTAQRAMARSVGG